jgi:hypothetical protein
VQRLKASGLAAGLAVGALLLVAAVPTAAQTANAPDVASPAVSATGDARATGERDPADRTAFGVPVYGNPPGFGAGATGFESSGTARRKARTKRPPPVAGAATGAAGAAIGATLAPATAPAPSASGGAQARQRIVPQLARRGAAPNDPPTPWSPPPIVVPPRRAAVDPTPFDPLGLRAGVFLIRPAVELSGGYDSNPQHATTPKGSSEFVAAHELTVRSDWERHALNADIRGSYTAFGESFPGSPARLDRPTLDSRLSGRIDASANDRVNLEGRLIVSTDNPGSPNIQAGLTRLPIVTTTGGTLGYAHDFNRLEIAVAGSADRSVYQDSVLTDGTTFSNDDRNFDQFGGTLRGSYELMPGVKPFVEAALDTRIHDIAIDRTGADRDSEGRTLRAGTTFRLTGKLTGEVSLGETRRTYEDPSLPRLSGPIFDASLIYAATPLTTMKLTARSTAGELVLPGASGVLYRDFGLEIDHDFRRWLTGAVKLGYGADSYFGVDRFDNRYTAGASLGYKITRTVQIKGEFRHDWLQSTVSGVSYEANIALLMVRLQR